jgi:hypothetical protein
MSFDLTDLHTLIVRAHDRHGIATGKVMRLTLQALADGKFPLHKYDASPLKLNPADHAWLRDLAASAEQQTEVRWWTKGPWPKFRAVLVPDTNFWEWCNTELDLQIGSPETAVVGLAAPMLSGPQINAMQMMTTAVKSR